MKHALISLAVLIAAGCQRNAVIYPNNDPTLNKTATQFAAEAARAFPYPFDAPKGGRLAARAEIGYALNQITLVNLSDVEWVDAQLWVNRTHVVTFRRIPPRELKRVSFKQIYDDAGVHFPLDNRVIQIDTLELFIGGVMYEVPKQLG